MGRGGSHRRPFLIARLLGMPVSDVLTKLTPAEYDGWRYHLARYPPAEYMLAYIWGLLAPTFRENPEAAEMGNWLESPRKQRERLEAERKAQQRAQRDQVQELYRAQKAAQEQE